MSEIIVRALTPELLPDYLEFFDRDAFVDNADWAGCYCYFHQAPHQEKPWQDRMPPENRAGASDLIGRGLLRGYMAYKQDKVVGWCNANTRMVYTTIGQEAIPMQADAAGIVCFIVAKPYRGMGIATRLLDAAVEGLTQQGMRSVYAFSRTDAKTAAENCVGPLAMYLKAGFEKLGERDGLALVRKNLKPEPESLRQ